MKVFAPVLISVSLCAMVFLHAQETSKHPIYLGARACGSCHSGERMGRQFSIWLMSKHARAYAALSMPEARKIAELSGIRQEPQDSVECLGCHTTAAEAEDWEKEDTFVAQDGVQCERCHGPGSEYATEEIMKDPEAAARAGLRMPSERDCMVCHAEKGSHVAVLSTPRLNIKEARAMIAHPFPEGVRSSIGRDVTTGPSRPEGVSDSARGGEEAKPKYAGATSCAGCHGGREMGFQYSRWRRSPHFQAWAVLASPAARKMAADRGITGDPQQSPECLRCHTTGFGENSGRFLPSFAAAEGVTCEACHGAGSEYSEEAVMRDPVAAARAGLKQPDRRTCLRCHDQAHGKPFDYAAAVARIAHPSHTPETAREPRYKTPLNLALRPDGRELYVTCSGSDSIVIVDPAARRKTAEISVGGQPSDVTFRPDGRFAYVSNMFDDTVSVIDTAAHKVVRTIAVGDAPHGLRTDAEGKRLYVLDTSADSISVFDTATLERVKNLAASREPWSLALSPDGRTIAVTHILSRFVKFRTPSMAEVTFIDTKRRIVRSREVVPAANLLMGIAWHPNGEFALVTLNRTKNLVPMTRLLQGWTITNGLAVLWKNGEVDQVLLDEPDQCFPDPTDVAFTPDGRLALVTSSGSDCVAVVDAARLVATIRNASPYERKNVLPNHLGKPTEFVIKHIPTKNSPRGILVMPDGKAAFVACSLDDSLTVIDLEKLQAVGRVDLGGPRAITRVRYGERLFHSANITFHRQFSCHTCHPDGHIDGLTYDIEPDGIGVSPVDNRSLRGILDTAPFKWEGTNPSLQRQCGPRLAVFFTRIQPFTPEQLAAVDNYICTIPRPPNRYHPVGSEYTPAQRRGKAIFERTKTNDGRTIPVERRCVTCHPPPLYTDRRLHDVGTRHPYDRGGEFDVPQLTNVYSTAPYLHNGIAETLEEIWTRFNPHDTHGITNDMTKDQLNDLIEFLKTL